MASTTVVAASEIPAEEAAALARISHAMYSIGQGALSGGWLKMEHDARGVESAFMPHAPGHLGLAVPKALVDVSGGAAMSVLSIVTAPTSILSAGVTGGSGAFAKKFAEHLGGAVAFPVFGIVGAIRDLYLGTMATPSALIQSVGLISGQPKDTLKVGIASIFPAGRGDVQPLIAVALRLQQAGVVVRLFIIDLTSEHSAALRSVGIDVVRYLSLSRMYVLIQEFAPDVFLYRWQHRGLALILEEQLGTQIVEYNMWPEPPDASYRWELVLSQKKILDDFLKVETLQHLTKQEVEEQIWKRPLLCAFSEEVVERHAYWPLAGPWEGFQVTGFWDLTSEQQEGFFRSADVQFFGTAVGGELEAFLAAGPPPVYLGWGSLTSVRPSQSLAMLAVRTLQLVGRRGIVLGSYSGLDHQSLGAEEDNFGMQAYSKHNVFWAKWVPHEWLLPQCCAAVHHGGCGTTAASLRAGRPTVVTPVIVDQFFWGYHVKRLGVGMVTAELSKIDAETLAAALKKCFEPDVKERAAELGERLQREDGAGRAAQWIQDYGQRAQTRKEDPAGTKASFCSGWVG